MSASPLIYIVDDDRDVRESIAFMLRTDGMSSHAFAGGRELLDALPDLAPGCILLDVRMPRMSGLDVLAALAEAGCGWPVVVMTGHGERELAHIALGLGARDFIEKPFDSDLLVECLKRLSA